ncbi:50S ribosomal protein L13 [Candidatus Woesearchaeota archaeon]|nr:50S ribosomal protein L13 [Candidatus Woesearchaeota archaeon]|tara:strand:- start:1443 stop:1859 length:417 start_codon:yes stop_codon:yes gene_type:complete
MIIDATNKILGRLATQVAKQALLGEEVKIIHCDKAIITGNRSDILGKYKKRSERGIPTKGPFIPRMSDRFVRRAIRGMLPYKQPKGREAFKRVLCYVDLPKEFEGKEVASLTIADNTKLPNTNFTTVKEICEFLGGTA